MKFHENQKYVFNPIRRDAGFTFALTYFLFLCPLLSHAFSNNEQWRSFLFWQLHYILRMKTLAVVQLCPNFLSFFKIYCPEFLSVDAKTAVKLKEINGDPQSSYINANFIRVRSLLILSLNNRMNRKKPHFFLISWHQEYWMDCNESKFHGCKMSE